MSIQYLLNATVFVKSLHCIESLFAFKKATIGSFLKTAEQYWLQKLKHLSSFLSKYRYCFLSTGTMCGPNTIFIVLKLFIFFLCLTLFLILMVQAWSRYKSRCQFHQQILSSFIARRCLHYKLKSSDSYNLGYVRNLIISLRLLKKMLQNVLKGVREISFPF